MRKKYRMLAIALCAAMLCTMAVPALAESDADANTSSTEAASAEKASTLSRLHEGMREAGFGLRIAKDHGVMQISGNLPLLQTGKTTQRTDEQKAAAEQAQAEWEAAYRAYLGKLAEAGILAQAELDAYDRVAQRQEVADAIDTMQWTMAKNIELQEALGKSGAERQAALAAFVTEGLLTREQADALTVSSGRSMDIDYDNWTVAQVKQLRDALAKTGEERAEALNGFVSEGLLTQAEADAMLCRGLGTVGKRATEALTDEQKTALEEAQKTLKERYEQIRETLNGSEG